MSIKLSDGSTADLASEEGREVLRHSTAHVMAQAVCDLFPNTKYAIGPPIQDGFYYDFDIGRAFTPEDLERIDARMREIIAAKQPFEREELSQEEALKRFADQPFKREIIEGVDEAEGAGRVISVYRNDGWADLCRGPHVQSTAAIPAFKLLRIAGAYWRGDERNPMLQRIYGTAWESQEALDAYLERLEEAAKRDHRKLGRELDLFSFPDELGGGLLVWHPKGGILRKTLEDFSRDINLSRGYQPVFSPHVARSVLWETSGHLAQYKDNMYPAMELEGADYYVKPMNCPFHVLVYKSKTRSYRDLPIRMYELGTVYRHERSGVLHGLLRVRGLTQDDSHIFCRRDQLVDEIIGVMELTLDTHQALGFGEPRIELSTKPGKAIGNEEMWNEATEALRNALDKWGKPYAVAEGEGAFYGPKIDFHFADAIGRYWQLTTIQVDFALPEAFDLHYAAGEDNKIERPVMIHRAILGSIERVTGVLLEHYAGAFPTWLAPVQVVICPIADRHNEHVENVANDMRAKGIRVEVDNRREKVGHKIRDAKLQKVPYILVIGDRDIEGGSAGVNPREGEEQRGVPLNEFTEKVVAQIRSRS
ncbi:MAG TPA: threonine--tRNA ligase [Actinomycetota bacterium]|nr:threonine--tRNA ligase [Actinomycetota bacterium]